MEKLNGRIALSSFPPISEIERYTTTKYNEYNDSKRQTNLSTRGKTRRGGLKLPRITRTTIRIVTMQRRRVFHRTIRDICIEYIITRVIRHTCRSLNALGEIK